MKTTLPLFAAFVLAIPCTLSTASAADAAPAHAVADCCNATCPVCDKAVVPGIAPTAFKPTESVKTKHPDIASAKVGFCSEACKAEYEKNPAKFEDKIVPQWTKKNQQQPKAGHEGHQH